MKAAIFFVAMTLGSSSVWAQTPPPGTISQPATSPNAFTNQVGTASNSFTNASAVAYSADQLAGQLRDLRSAVDRTLPVLSALTESYSNASGNQSIAGRLEGLLSGARNRGSSQASTA